MSGPFAALPETAFVPLVPGSQLSKWVQKRDLYQKGEGGQRRGKGGEGGGGGAGLGGWVVVLVVGGAVEREKPSLWEAGTLQGKQPLENLSLGKASLPL